MLGVFLCLSVLGFLHPHCTHRLKCYRAKVDMINWVFELNGKPMSELKSDRGAYAAFSGLGNHINKRVSACLKEFGPIPPGTY